MSGLREVIEAEIEANGPIGVARYMELCLTHPEFGYYSTQRPFGKKGDFITAPEVSQMFGELVGLWLLEMWENIGAPAKFALVELGPGRGTLMADILRVARLRPAFLDGATICLLEASQKLRNEQSAALHGHNITHIESLEALPDMPLILVANEFFDALPIRQWVKNDFGWQERRVHKGLAIGLSSTVKNPVLDARFPDIETGRVVEISPAAEAFADGITSRIMAHTGAALIIDYGDFEGIGDTLQAVKAHKMVPAFEAPGEVDLTAHVRFSDLVQHDVPHSFTTQGQFLAQLGIEARRKALEKAGGKALLEDQKRLVDPDKMGQLFKVLALYAPQLEHVAGFEHEP